VPTISLDRYYRRAFERTDTNERILRLVSEVEAARRPGDVTDRANANGMLVGRPMREVEPRDGHPRLDELPDPILGRGADRAHELCRGARSCNGIRSPWNSLRLPDLIARLARDISANVKRKAGTGQRNSARREMRRGLPLARAHDQSPWGQGEEEA